MKKIKNKITVFLDLNDSKGKTLKSAVSLAKMIDGEISVFHVKKPSDIIGVDNQLSAMRTINSEHTTVNKKIRNLIEPISEEYDIPINHSFAFGNVKNEIGNYIKENRSDIIVLGKRKSKPLKFIGNGIREFVLSEHKGAILIVPDKNHLKHGRELSLGILNDFEPSLSLKFAEDLLSHTQKPLKSFKFVKPLNKTEEIHIPSNKKTIEYVFEHNDSTVKNLTKYLSKSNIDLLLIDREKKRSDNETNLVVADIKDLMSKINIPLLVSGTEKLQTQGLNN